MFKKISFYLATLACSFSLLSNSLPNREAIILLDTRNLEFAEQSLTEDYNYTKPMGIGAISNAMIFALHQKAAPIVTNKSLIKNIIDHQNIFNDFAHLNLNDLTKKYGHYNKFKAKDSLKAFQANCQYINTSVIEINKILGQKIKNNNLDHIYQILNEIEHDKRFNINSAPSIIKECHQNDNIVVDLQLEIIIYLLCSSINFEKDWDIKQVNDDIFLLIPKNYIESLNLTISKVETKSNYSIKYTDLELNLGLKIDHMKNVSRNFFEQKGTSTHREIPFNTSLGQIFITQDDIKTLKNPLKHVWSIFMSGHGTPASKEINALPQLHELKKLYQNKLSADQSSIEYQNKIKQLDEEIKRSELINSDKSYHSTILSLSVEEFRDMLKFLNNSINTSVFYYQACFGGGNHLNIPYVENNKPLLLNYHIITGTPSDNVTYNEFPIIKIPPYSSNGKAISYQPSQIHIDDIDIENKRLQINTTLNFGKFFKAARKNIERTDLLCYALHPHTDQSGQIISNRIPSIPLIRFANSNQFQPIPNDKSSVILDNKNSAKSISINTNAALINSDYISQEIILNKIDGHTRPQLFSIVPGSVLHTFEQISSTTFSLQEIINCFLTFSELSSAKVFWIKNLTCKNDKNGQLETFKDAIIMRNIFNTNALMDNKQEKSETCAYFSNKESKESKLTWDGPFLETNNFKIQPIVKPIHKEECLNYFPQAKNYVNPILQSI